MAPQPRPARAATNAANAQLGAQLGAADSDDGDDGTPLCTSIAAWLVATLPHTESHRVTAPP